MRIFYINRDVDSDRREMMKAALQETGIEAERVPGVDGYDAPDWLAAFYDRKMPPGESGCSASHLLVSSKIIAENLPWAVVLEDDARPKAGFLQAVEDAVANAPADWDVIRLTRRSKWSVLTVCALPDHRRLIQYSKIPPGTQGLIVSRSGASKLLTPRIVREPIDVEIKRPWKLKLKVLAIEPCIVDTVPQAILPSVVGKRSRPRDYDRIERHLFNIRQFGLSKYLYALVASLTRAA
jgi:glycosyl transferase, family 25